MAKELTIKIKIPNFGKLFALLFFYFRKASLRVAVDVVNKKWRGLFVLVVSIVIYFFGGLSAALMWLLFLLFLVYEWDNRIIAFLAIVSLATCPFLIYFKKDDWAEMIAIYAYYFLIMTVVLQIVEHNIEQRREHELINIWFK